MRLNGKRSLVTGGGSGIGLAIATSFVEAGASVAIAGRNREKLEAARLEAGELSRHIAVKTVDVADPEQVRELIVWVEREIGAIDILVNNAGVNVPARELARLDPDDWRKMVDVNLNGAFYCIHEILPRMRARKDGLIINISSVAGVRIGEVAGAGYSASKYGMSALSYFTGIEERVNGIRSSLICPGEVNTAILDDRPNPMPMEERMQILQPEDVAAAALFIATLPRRAAVPELVITPSSARFG